MCCLEEKIVGEAKLELKADPPPFMWEGKAENASSCFQGVEEDCFQAVQSNWLDHTKDQRTGAEG